MITCEYKNHPMTRDEEYVYEDEAHGLKCPIRICRGCLIEHCHKYYPGSPNDRHHQQQFPELYKQITEKTS